MPESPDSLKKYLPGPLFALLTIAWWAGGDRVKEWVQVEITQPAASIRIHDEKNHLHIVRIEISPHSDKAFEEVQVEVDLQAKPADIKGELTALDRTHTPLGYIALNYQETMFLFNKVGVKGSPITMKQRETIEIRLHEDPAAAVLAVSINSKDHKVIEASDLNQRYRLAEAAWRAGLAVLGICGIYFLYKLLLRLFSRRARKQLEEDAEFLHKCWQGDAASLATFDTELQPVIDAGTAKYLKAFTPVVRDNARRHVIRQAIFERADTLPQFRRSLKGQVQGFVITFCVGIVQREYNALKKSAKKEIARIW